ncbi:MAG: GNAT family N-acetyltransferase [Gaiellales bacterium]
MSRTVISLHLADQAAAAAQDAAARARVEVRELDDVTSLSEVDELFRTIWGPTDRNLVGVAILRALSHSGNYVVGAHDGSKLAGALVGFRGEQDGERQLHSHILGVLPDLRNRSVGFALKEHQRAWGLARGITTVTWTFDPLVRRNAYFNLTKLGAAITRYYTNFYGDLNDDINGHEESDRVLIEWHLDSEPAIAASTVSLSEPNIATLKDQGAAEVLTVTDDGGPEVKDASADTLLVGIPEDVVALRRRDESVATRWRHAVRDVLGSALNDGYATTGMTRSGYYVVQR